MIKSAYYGEGSRQLDVTEKIKNDFSSKKSIFVSNHHFGSDPCVGILKKLKINLENGEEYLFTENTLCYFGTLDKNFHKCDRLGIFYTNNVIKSSIINKSLETIYKAKNTSGKTEIVVCPQIAGQQRYFLEVESIFKSGGHINIVTQILQALNTVKSYQNFKYVSFLEHDVMYPEDYFNYDDFNEDCVCNENYIGICKDGFQKKDQNHQPLHEMTMRYDFAIKYFERLLLVYMRGEFELLEPPIKKGYHGKNPSVHINHGNHFTSHYSIYSRSTTKSNDYWGEFNDYEKLFN